MHTVAISLIADQEIHALGRIVNIHDIVSIILNGSGEITRIVERKPKYNWFASYTDFVVGVDREVLRAGEIEKTPIIRIALSDEEARMARVVSDIKKYGKAFYEGLISEQELVAELKKIEAAWASPPPP